VVSGLKFVHFGHRSLDASVVTTQLLADSAQFGSLEHRIGVADFKRPLITRLGYSFTSNFFSNSIGGIAT
jgi:hypothetical protein